MMGSSVDRSSPRGSGERSRAPLRVVVLLAALAAVAAAAWLTRGSRPAVELTGGGAERIWVVDAGFATQYPRVVEAIETAGGQVRVFDFPGATLANGNRYVWARDYGPLQMPGSAAGWAVWDARNGGSATARLEHDALPRLASLLGVRYQRLEVEVQGGNWLPLPDGRVLTTRRFLEDNRELGSRAEIEALLERVGIRGVIEISPMPGELTRHADMVLAVEPLSGNVFVAELWQQAIDLIPGDAGWDMYREMALAIRESLERTTVELRGAVGEQRVFRFPQPLPYLDPHPDGDRYRPTFPSFVNGIFVTGEKGRPTYLYGLAKDDTRHYYSFDFGLLDAYREEVDRVASTLGFVAQGIETGDLIRNGGSLHCATVECWRYPRPQDGSGDR